MFVGCLELQIYISEVHVSFLSLLCSSASLWFSTWLTNESASGVNNKIVENFLSFPESLRSPLWDV